MFKFLSFFKKDTSNEVQKMILIEEIQNTNKALNAAYMGFNNALEPDMIDCYIYEVNSIQKRYKFLIENAKTLGITYDKTIPCDLTHLSRSSCNVSVQSLL